MDRRPYSSSAGSNQMKPRTVPAPSGGPGAPAGSPAVVLEDGPSQARAALEPKIYIKIDEYVDNSITLIIPVGGFEVGETKLTKNHCLKIRTILEERLGCRKQLRMVLSRALSVAHFNRLWESVSPNAAMFDWRDPNNPSRTTTFFVKRVNKGQPQPRLPQGISRGVAPGGPGPRLLMQSATHLQPRAPGSLASNLTPTTRLPASRSGAGSTTALRYSAPGVGQRAKPKSKPEVIDIESSSEGSEEYSVSDSSEDDEEEMPKNNKTYLSSQKNVSNTVGKPDNVGKTIKPAKKSIPQAPTGETQAVTKSSDSNTPAGSTLPKTNQSNKQDSPKTSVMVVKGGRVIQNKKILWRLPGKTVVPSRKKIQTFYRIPNISTFQKAHFNPKKVISYAYHPFLGKGFVVALPPLREEDLLPPPIKKQKSLTGSGITAPAANSSKKPPNKTKKASEESNSSSDSENDRRRLRSRQAKAKNNSSIPTKQNKTPSAPEKRPTDGERRTLPDRKRVVLQQMTDSSSSSSSSSSSDNSSSSSESEPEFVPINEEEAKAIGLTNKTTTKSRNPLSSNDTNVRSNSSKNLRSQNQPPPPPVRKYDKGYPSFAQIDPNMPLRKDSEGRIYFDTTSRLKPSEFHTNEDTFVNWDKFVRNESGVGSFFKTILRHKQSLCFLIIFHLTYDEYTIAPKVDRSIELCSNGTVKVFLEEIDITQLFFSFMDIRTNHDLMAMLLNLQHAYTCPGAGNDLNSIHICPVGGHVLRNGQWFSASCKKIVFDPDHALFKIKSRCGPCNTLRKNLCMEKVEIEKSKKTIEVSDRKKLKKVQKSTNTKIIREKPPEPAKLQLRESLTDFLKQMWRDMGLTEFEEEAQQETDEKPCIENANGKLPSEVIESSSVPPVGEEVSVTQDGGTGVNLPIQEGTELPATSAVSNHLPISEPAPPPVVANSIFEELPNSLNPLFQPPPIPSNTPDLLNLSDLTFTSAEMNAMIPEDFTSLEMMINSSGENSSLLFGDTPSNSYGQNHQQMQPPMSAYPPQQVSNHNFVYSQEPMDVTSTTGSLQGSIMCSGVFGGPVNPNIAVPVDENPPVVPNSTNDAESSSLAGAISMSLLFPTFEDML